MVFGMNWYEQETIITMTVLLHLTTLIYEADMSRNRVRSTNLFHVKIFSHFNIQTEHIFC